MWWLQIVLAVTILLHRYPDLVGLATHYGAVEGAQTRSGEVYQASSRTCAVPKELWSELKGRRLLLLGWNRGALHSLVVKVNDTGRLTEAGLFEPGDESGPAFVSTDNEANGVPAVIDLPYWTHRSMSGDGETFLVMAFMLGD